MEAREVFRTTGAVLTGHFVYKSKKHGNMYVNKDRVYVFPDKFDDLCAEIVDSLDGVEFDVVAGPAIGGAILSQVVALNTFEFFTGACETRAVYAEKEVGPDGKETGNFIFKRGYDQVVKGQDVVVVEDVLTTGGSARKTIEAVRAAGGEVVAVRALWNRGGVTAETLTVDDFESLVEERFVDYPASDCPLCALGTPINTEVGHGAAFVSEHGQPQKKT